MTKDEARALGERLVKCEGFRWMEGMLTTHGARVLRSPSDFDECEFWFDGHIEHGDFESGEVPDLRDPATVGCVEEMLRNGCGGHLVLNRGLWGWSVQTGMWTVTDAQKSYEEGLVQAMESVVVIWRSR